MRKISLFILAGLLTFSVNAQELLCTVRINSSQVQTSDRKVFQTMQTSVHEFVNNTKWTSANIKNEEKDSYKKRTGKS